MIGRTNTGGGGGGSLKDTDAILAVTVPTGSTVTMTKGGVTLTPTIWTSNADNTLDVAIFSIPASTFDGNSWTVTATLGTESASYTIVIDSAEEYSIELHYRLWLFQTGDTSGWTAIAWRPTDSSGNATMPTLTFDYNDTGLMRIEQNPHAGVTYHTAKVDLTDYDYVQAKGNYTVQNVRLEWNGLYIFSQVGTGYYEAQAVAKANVPTDGGDLTLTIDVSNLTGSYYVAFAMRSNGSGAHNVFTIEGVWLTNVTVS